jgi:repressor LexA
MRSEPAPPSGRAPAKRPRGATRERVYRFVATRLRQGDPPTVREIRDALGLRATQTVQAHLQALVADGRLEQEPVSQRGRARGYRLPLASDAPQLVPLLGRVAAGLPSFAHQEVEGYVAFVGAGRGHRGPLAAAAPRDALFALRVVGESMVEAAILPGDVVIVRRDVEARDGDVVVALVGDEATVKVLRQGAAGPELHPANAAFAVQRPNPEDLRILGRVVEVRRALAVRRASRRAPPRLPSGLSNALNAHPSRRAR